MLENSFSAMLAILDPEKLIFPMYLLWFIFLSCTYQFYSVPIPTTVNLSQRKPNLKFRAFVFLAFYADGAFHFFNNAVYIA